MRFSIAMKGKNVSKDIESCESFLIYNEEHSKVIFQQTIMNPGRKLDLSDFLCGFNIEAILCGNMDSLTKQVFDDKGIIVVTGVSDNPDKAAEKFALMVKKQANMKSCLQPSPKVLVSCRNLNGENNVLAVGYCGNCSYNPPMVMVGIVPERYSYHMIKESGCFVVNLVDKNYREIFDYLGSHSKRDGNKLEVKKVRLLNGKKVNAPILLDCPVNIECTVVDSILTGSHEMFVGRVEYVHANGSLVNDEGNIDYSQINFI
jgi:flavin reductase (DIM6/NTAB) family NADH-FMN oxidoreductase RutF